MWFGTRSAHGAGIGLGMGQADALAVLGGRPSFENPVPVGQFYFPEFSAYEEALRAIFKRRYYTSQGPVTEHLEDRLAKFLQVKNAVCVTNATLGLMMALQAMRLSGRVVVPSWTFIGTIQA